MDFDTNFDNESTLIERNRVFVLIDGAFVVRWSENRVQELETGLYRTYNREDYGAPVTDYELNQLQMAGLIEKYDEEFVWLSPLPERPRVHEQTAWEKRRSRSYYLNTTLPGMLLQDVTDLLDDLGLSDRFEARVRDDFVVLWRSKGLSFQRFDGVEKARAMLALRSPEAFENTVVAFIETTMRK